MTNYKKPEPQDHTLSMSMTHSKPSTFKPDIEWYLAEIINLAQKWTGKILSCETEEIREDMNEIIDRVRKVWDLTPDKETCCHCFCCVECQGACHHCGESYVENWKDKND